MTKPRSTRSPRRNGLPWLACAIAATAIAPAQAQAATEIVLHNFAGPPKGAFPYAGVIRDSAGNLYGTTQAGGTANAGVLFKVDSAGHLIVLHTFTGGADGGQPDAGVIGDSAGNLYGTAEAGGAAGAGVVYKLDATGHETVLYSFTGGGADGESPVAGVIRDSAGNLYGTTYYGGFVGGGIVYKLDASGHETVLHSFAGGSDGYGPYGGVIRDSAGNLYGTTFSGGAGNMGTVYKLDSAGNYTVLYSFANYPDGSNPSAGVIRDTAGNLYGTTGGGGAGRVGTVYKLDTSGHETVLYSFTGGAGGGYPNAGVIRDSAGNLYGTTPYFGTSYAGVVYKLDTAGQETVLYTFTSGADGSLPNAGVVRDSAGNLYGTTVNGGPGNVGMVYKLDAAGNETAVYSFPGYSDGLGPQAGVIGDSAGNLYGTTSSGGTANAGVVYKLDTSGHETVLYNFTGGADARYPNAGVIRDSSGNLYGTTPRGGTWSWGAVYKLDTNGLETVLHNFTGGAADGVFPNPGIIRDSAGNLYGTTQSSGAANAGIVYKLDTSGLETVLYNFTGGADGGYPAAGVIRDSAGNLYGTAGDGGSGGWGVVYRLDTTGNLTVVHSFTGGADGGFPVAGVIRDSAGNLYGTAYAGGAAGAGVVYKLDTTGQETVLYSFTGGADGGHPEAGVIRDAAGNLYGTTYNGGATNVGVVYKLDTASQETVLYSFTGGADGRYPAAGVIRDSAGNLYGATSSGGKWLAGVVFKVKP